VIAAQGVPIAVSSSTNDVIAACASQAKWPAKTNAVATAATTSVAVERVARGTIASRSRPIE
jgi:hypothetical protein